MPSQEPASFRRWLVRYPAGESVDITCDPAATRAEILESHPEAVAAEPFEPTVQRPDAPLSAEDELRVRRWLDHIDETDPTTIAEVLHACEADAAARAYFLGRAGEAGPDDDRRTCRQCCNLSWSGLCLAAHRGEVPATSRDHHPIPDRLHRCVGYVPNHKDMDRRLGIERWPGMLILEQQGKSRKGNQ
jgi:hypothetical protein